ncbi:response regulator containing a CheY-like receiver domain and a GGDEF domain [Beggiatoa alba B18LD]|uniref:Response regulator containing a CheY-like receiver domain and a GGDEF domain n=1 Tax=Beggiatoa alba B18LD TaxID=395493 RepID=I3CHE1_9GAMM|nr:response regulator [Beggiatoa alba]EIJ43034.1 response regulator containing a CheY-like receiver domain and a GGDEF domain [Beggiatoa alba B18LD]
MNQTLSPHQATVLVVDDAPENLGVLSAYLEATGLDVMTALSGNEALSLITRVKPDLILLDVMMPNMDGYETCRQLKSNLETSDIPVIFVTALMDMESKIKCFSLGAVDYLVKPIQQGEILARVHTHIIISALQKQLVAQNRQLQEQHETLDNFTRMAAHELFPPLVNIASAISELQVYRRITNTETEHCLMMLEDAHKQVLQVVDNLLNKKPYLH